MKALLISILVAFSVSAFAIDHTHLSMKVKPVNAILIPYGEVEAQGMTVTGPYILLNQVQIAWNCVKHGASLKSLTIKVKEDGQDTVTTCRYDAAAIEKMFGTTWLEKAASLEQPSVVTAENIPCGNIQVVNKDADLFNMKGAVQAVALGVDALGNPETEMKAAVALEIH